MPETYGHKVAHGFKRDYQSEGYFVPFSAVCALMKGRPGLFTMGGCDDAKWDQIKRACSHLPYAADLRLPQPTALYRKTAH